MTIEEIKKKAPKGSTHYNYNTETYYKQCDVLYFWEGEWRFSWYKNALSMIYIKPL